MLAYNLIHNLGNIYDDVAAIISMSIAINFDDPNWWSTYGKLIGDAIN